MQFNENRTRTVHDYTLYYKKYCTKEREKAEPWSLWQHIINDILLCHLLAPWQLPGL